MISLQVVQASAAMLPSTTRSRIPRFRHRASPARRYLVRARHGGGGDRRVQEALARVAALQVRKVRVANFLDDCYAHLLRLAEDADTELDTAAKDGLWLLDAAGEEIMERLERKLHCFDGVETEETGMKTSYWDRIDLDTNDESGRYTTRRNVYLVLMGLIWLGMMHITVFATPTVHLGKFGALCLIFLALVVQVCYEEDNSMTKANK